MLYTKTITEDLKELYPDAFIISNYSPEEYVKVEMLAPVNMKQNLNAYKRLRFGEIKSF